MAKLSAIKLYDASRVLQSDPGGVEILACVSGNVIRRQVLGDGERLTLTLLAFTPAATTIEGDGFMSLRRRRILRLEYDDASFREYRITDVRRDVTGQTPCVVSGLELAAADLQAHTPRQTLADDKVEVALRITGLSPQDALDALISTTWGRPAYLKAGTVDALVDSSTVVDLRSDGTLSFADMLRQLADQTESEVSFSYNSGSSRYEVNLYSEIGWTASEYTAGTPDPSKRPIEIATGANNRRRLTRRSDDRGYVSRVIPLTVIDEVGVTVGGARWSATTSGSVVTFTGENPVYVNDALIGAYVGADAVAFYEITDSDASAGTVTVSGTPSGLNGRSDIRFAEDSGGTELVWLDHPDAVDGTKEEAQLFTYIPPYNNLVTEAGHTADFGTFSSGLPVGWTKIDGGETIAQNTDARWNQIGASSVKVTASSSGDGIEAALTLTPSSEAPWFSAWVYLRVTSGTVGIVFVDSAGDEHPAGTKARSNADNLVAIKVEGFEPASGAGSFQIRAVGGSSVFYVDAITVTQSPSAYDYAEEMGPRGLWAEGARYIKSAEYADAYESEFLDYDFIVDAGHEPVELGSHVRVNDAPNTSGGHDIQFDSRVVEIEAEEDAVTGALTKRVKLSRSVRDFTDRFKRRKKRVGFFNGVGEDLDTIPEFIALTTNYDSSGDVYLAYQGDDDFSGFYYRFNSGSGFPAATPEGDPGSATFVSGDAGIESVWTGLPYGDTVTGYAQAINLDTGEWGKAVQLQITNTRRLNWRGAWTNSYGTYELDDAVSHNGASYVCISSHDSTVVTDEEPGVGASWATYWDVLAAKGNTGSTGNTGSQGPQGNPGSAGTNAIDARCVPSNGTGWVRAKHAGSWSPAGTTTDLDFDFNQGGTPVCRDSKRVTLDTGAGTLTVSDTTHPSGDLDSAGFTVTGSGTSSVTITASYGTAEKTVTVVAIQGGDQGNTGSVGNTGSTGADANRWAGEFEFQPVPGSIDTKVAYVQEGGNYRAHWATATDYIVGDVVRHSGIGDVYYCYSSHTSGASTEPGIGGSWSTKWYNTAAYTEPDIEILAGTYTLDYATPELTLSGTGFNYVYFDPDVNNDRLLATTSLSTAVSKGTGGNRVLVGLARAGATSSDYAFFVPYGGTTPITTVDTLYAKDLQALFAQIDDLTVKDVLMMGSGGKITNSGSDYEISEDGVRFETDSGATTTTPRGIDWYEGATRRARTTTWIDVSTGIRYEATVYGNTGSGGVAQISVEPASPGSNPTIRVVHDTTNYYAEVDNVEWFDLKGAPLQTSSNGTPSGVAGYYRQFCDAQELPKALVGAKGPLGIPTTWYSLYTATTIANTTTETTLLGTGKGDKTLPASHLVQGSTFRLRASGIMSTDGNTLTIRPKVGGTALDSIAIVFSSTYSSRHWDVDVDFVVASVSGSTAYLRLQGVLRHRVSPSAYLTIIPFETTATTTITSITSSKTIDLTAQWSAADAADTITCTNATIEQLY